MPNPVPISGRTTQGARPGGYVVEQASDIIYVASLDGRFTHFNPTATGLLGYSAEELLGRSYLDLVRPDAREELRRFYGRQYIRRVTNTYREFPAVAKDGSTVWLGQNVQLLSGPDGAPQGFQAVARDITARVQAREVAERQGRVLDAIARGRSLDQVLGMICEDVEHLTGGFLCSVLLARDGRLKHGAAPSLPAAYVESIDGRAVSLDAWAFEGGEAAAPGRLWRLVRARAARHGLRSCWEVPIRSPAGEVRGFVAIYSRDKRKPSANDLTLAAAASDAAGIAIEKAVGEERVRSLQAELERRVEERTAQLGAANELLQREIARLELMEQQLFQARNLESVGRLAGGVAHEFNNWLTVILLHAEQLALEHALGESDAIREIRKAAERASTLTRQLLAFGRKQVLQPKCVPVNDLISNLSKMLKTLMGGSIRVELDLDPGAGAILADPLQFEQVIVNLALNARDAMPRGGVFRISTQCRTVEAGGGIDAGDYVIVEVADTGIGMEAGVRERIFDPFFTTKEAGRGSGLGLSTVYGVVHQSGGHISVDSMPGAGSKFSIVLPRAEPAPPDDTPAAVIRPRSSAPASILVVDDEHGVRSLVAKVLAGLGYTVQEAGSPDEALRIASDASRTIDLLLTDVVMPGMSGPELAAKVRAMRPAVGVIFVSGHAQPDEPGPDPIGGEAYLAKPFHSRQLAAKIEEVLGSR